MELFYWKLVFNFATREHINEKCFISNKQKNVEQNHSMNSRSKIIK